MSKRILTEIGSDFKSIRNAAIDEGTNMDIIRVYGAIGKYNIYAVIIADDNIFEGL